ncbi:MAG TPA: hypothetical protein VD913_05795, partial [bacterium]|nr:hypothetical protein [bacterium]
NGWLFGRGDEASTDHDRAELFRLFEDTILPAYFDRSDPTKPFSLQWLKLMKESIYLITKQFNTNRMLTEYIEKMYLPAFRSSYNVPVGERKG